MAKKKYYTNKHGVKIDLNYIKLGKKYEEKVNKKLAEKREKILKKEFIKSPTRYNKEKVNVAEEVFYRARKYGGETPFEELNSVRFNPDAFQSNKQAKRKVDYLRKRTTKQYESLKQKIYKENLIKSIRTKFSNVGDPQMEEMIKKIRRMNKTELNEFAYTTEVYNIDFVYGNPETEDNYKIFKETVNEFYENKYKKGS